MIHHSYSVVKKRKEKDFECASCMFFSCSSVEREMVATPGELSLVVKLQHALVILLNKQGLVAPPAD